jgi:hypothetical protein
VSLAAASAIGVAVAVRTSLWLLPFVAVGAFIAVAYNLELFGGRFHGDPWFSLAWGAFPVVATYVAIAETIRAEAVLAALFAALLSHAQRRLSTPVRFVRRSLKTSPDTFTADAERALRAIAAGVVALGLALVLFRVT